MRAPFFLFVPLFLTACGPSEPSPFAGQAAVVDPASSSSVDSGLLDTGTAADTAGEGTTPGTVDTADGSGTADDACQSGTVIELTTGPVEGVVEGDLRVFRGIPYAAPPTGALRLRDPQPVTPWSDVRDASAFGHACPQSTVAVLDWLSQVDDTDEDCLTLNVWAHDDGTKKPVMVWLHGGAFFYGAGSQDLYDGTAIASEDVVMVSINYRLGALGFLAHPELGAQVGNDNPGNFGLKDQVAALQWVHDNIAAFGGDPSNVTVFGESAGAISTCVLATLPQTDGLMHKAIGQSIVGCHALPSATVAGAIGGLAPAELAADAVESLGCDEAPDLLACLQELPADDFVGLVNTAGLLSDPHTAFPTPYIDGSFVPEPPAEVYARGEADLPMIVGTNGDEATMFLSLAAPLTWLGMDDAVDELLGTDAYTEGVLERYPVWDYLLPADAFLTFATDGMFSCPNRALADAASPGAPVFLYEFQERSLTTLALGSHHALELPYVFDTYASMGMLLPPASDVALGDTMRVAWTHFAHTGTPGTQGWEPWQPGGTWMRFDDASSPSSAPFREGRCDALEEIGLGTLAPF